MPANIITRVLTFVAYRFIRSVVRVWREAHLRRNGVSRAL